MAHTVISVKLPPNIDPTKARLAYGDRALPKLVSIVDSVWRAIRSSNFLISECRFFFLLSLEIELLHFHLEYYMM